MIIYIGALAEKYYYGVYNLLTMIYPTSEVIRENKNVADISYEVVLNGNSINIIRNNIIFPCKLVLEDKILSIKILIYELENASLPFGVFTGIRPTKTFLQYDKNASAILENIYFISPKKVEIIEKCATLEKQLSKSIPKRYVSIYVNIPFCPTRCKYCSFIMANMKNQEDLLKTYFDVLMKDLIVTSNMLKEMNIGVYSVYVGGGTPSILDTFKLNYLTKTIKECFSYIREFTVEAGRADTVTKEKLQAMYENGVTRISINPQTLNDDTLKNVGRKHTVQQFYDAYNCAINVGFRNINTDLILALGTENFKDYKNTIDKIIELSPQSVTLHTLCQKRCASEKFEKTNEVEKMIDYSYDILKTNYEPYYIYRQKNALGSFENTGFVNNSDICAYNIIMMEEISSVVSIGAGGTSKLISYDEKKPFAKLRCDKQPHTYISQIDNILERKKRFLYDGKDKI